MLRQQMQTRLLTRMKNKISVIINKFKDKDWRKFRLRKILRRLFIPIIWSVVCSNVGLFFLFAAPSINTIAIMIAAVSFLILLVRHIFIISFYRRHSQTYMVDVLGPWMLFAFLAAIGFFFIPPAVFNHIFLPLRACEPFYLRSWVSIILVLLLMLGLMSATREVGRKTRIKLEEKRRKRSVKITREDIHNTYRKRH